MTEIVSRGRSYALDTNKSTRKTFTPLNVQTMPEARQRLGASACDAEGVARGLSKGHNSTDCKCLLSVDGMAVELIRPYRGEPAGASDKSKRELITHWSEKSRQRLRWLIANIKKEALAQALFVTLTYPEAFPACDDHETYKGHLNHFTVSLRRYFHNRVSGIWKLEFQKRGAAHYHLLLLGIPQQSLESFRTWTALEWFKVVGSGDDKHLRAGTGVEAAKSANGAACYLAKYISKDDQTRPGNFTGRYWGVIGREQLPMSSVQTVLLDERSMIKVQRWARKLIAVNMKKSRWNNFLASKKGERHRAMFGESMQDWDRLRSAYHGGGQHLAFIGENSSGWISTLAVRSTYEMRLSPPAKWNVCSNTTVRLICNAPAFLNMLKNGIAANLLHAFSFCGPAHPWAWPADFEPAPF